MTPEHPGYSGPALCRLTAREAIAALRSGEVTSADLIEAATRRMAETGPAINATVTLCAERARAQSPDPGSRLGGLPLLIKDLTAVAGVRSTQGTPALAEEIPEQSHPLVLRLEAQGGVVLGKSNTPELGAGANTFNAIFGATRNPWDTRMNAGGSSGGAAAALAAGEIWLAHGSDLGGSCRTPASFCGIVGLRPSPGTAGGGPQGRPFDTMPVQGPMARTVADCALFLDAMSGSDPALPLAGHAPDRSYLDTCLDDPGPVRMAFAPDLGGLAPVEPVMAETLAAALSRIDIPGLVIEEAAPALGDVDRTFRVLRALGFWADAREKPDAVTRFFKPALQQNIAEGRALGIDEIAEALTARGRIFETMRAFLSTHDVLACPVTGAPPLPVEIEYPPSVAGEPCRDYLDWLRFAFPATLAGLPALSLPVGFTPEGLPVGLQLIGRARGEGRLLQIAAALEAALDLPATPIDPVVRHGA